MIQSGLRLYIIHKFACFSAKMLFVKCLQSSFILIYLRHSDTLNLKLLLILSLQVKANFYLYTL